MKKEKSDVCYEYKDGRFLKACYIGDGEFEIVLTEKISKDCMVSTDWSLAEILRCCDGVYDDSGDFIADTLDESDFAIHKAE